MFDKRWVQLFIAIKIALLITSATAVSTKKRHYARSSKDLRELAELDFATISQLKNLKNSLQRGSSLLETVESYLDEFADATAVTDVTNITRHVDDTVRNPLSIFKLIQRVVYFFKDMEDEPVGIPGLPLAQLAGEFQGETPFKEDLRDFVNSILRIQFAYDLNVTDLLAGKVYGRETGTTLVAADCLDIGVIAKAEGQNALAVEWLKEAERLALIDDTVDIYKVQSKLVQMIKLHDEPVNISSVKEAHFFMKPLLTLSSMKRENRKVRNVLYEKYAGKGRNCSYWDVNYWGLCGGANLQAPETTLHLFCWLEFKIHKIFEIGPLKMEFLSRNPDIVQIHNAFSDEEVAEIVPRGREPKPSVSGDTVEKRMNRKIETMTGLQSTEISRVEQAPVVNNYVPGGHSEFHVDSMLEERVYRDREDRRVSFMVYLNDVDAGGFTVFPAALAAAVPTKGSVVYWFNTFSDGSHDYSTTHAGCPVVLGEKWISNKWIRFHGQFTPRNGSTSPKERFQVPVNGKFLPVPEVFRHNIIEEHEAAMNCVSLPAVDEPPRKLYNGQGYTYVLTPSLKALILLDWKIYQIAKEMFTARMDKADDTSQQSEIMSNYIQSFNESTYNALEVEAMDKWELVEKLAWNPLANYRTFWRFENFIKPWVMSEIQEPRGSLKDFRDYIQQVYDVSDGPSEMDMVEAIKGILRIQYMYNLKSKDMAKGLLAGTDAGIVLTAEECIQIGDHALASRFYYQAVDWLETAVQKITYEGDGSTTLENAKDLLETAKNIHDLLLGKLENWDENFYISPIAAVGDPSARQTRIEQSYNNLTLRNESPAAHINYWGICQGRPHQSTTETSKLFCWHETEVHPYWKIGPLRAEILSLHDKAEVVQYHDVLTDKALLAFWRNGTNRKHSVSGVGLATVVRGNKYLSITDSRLSTVSWVPLSSSTEAMRIAKLVNRVTGFEVLGHDHSALQIATYGPGGHYDAHTDSEGYDEHLHNARIGTLMFYLSDVMEGGGTAFSQAGIHVTPKTGSAIFWPTLLRAGDVDEKTWHGACPVIFGEKIVATQWIMYGMQHHLQCHTDRTKRVEVLVNGKSKYNIN